MMRESDYDKLRNFLVRTRFPGFTEEVASAYWEANIEAFPQKEKQYGKFAPDSIEMATHLDGIFSLRLDDLFRPSAAQKHIADEGNDARLAQIAEWLGAVWRFFDEIEGATFGQQSSALVEALALHKDNVSAIESRRREENASKPQEQAEVCIQKETQISDLPHRRITSIYKIILGLAVNKFHYRTDMRNDASSMIEKRLSTNVGSDEFEFAVGSETIRNILLDASDILGYRSPSKSSRS